MKGTHGLSLLVLLFTLFLLNGCSPELPDTDQEPAATVAADFEPPFSIGSESSHLIRPTPANPEEKVEPTRAISAETNGNTLVTAGNGPQTNNINEDEPVHRHSHRLYLLVVIRH